MLEKLFVSLEFYDDKATYFARSDGNISQFYVSGIEEMGPRPSKFPSNAPVHRVEGELKLIFIMLSEINNHEIIVGRKEELKRLYYQAKKLGIREGAIPRKLSWLNVKPLRFCHDELNKEMNGILDTMNALKTNQMTHWDALHLLYLQLKFDSMLVNGNGVDRQGIFEVFIDWLKKKHKPDKNTLWRYF